ncbi:MAG: hypothetical protein KVP17_003627 [Porospora cf. gigantea B]|uniref:uncharacterized protein n=2 Tax=Porospora cf. gigantea B TaxID=2853592 RepID=UPI0035719919|nr:MAG: hypothetical protein KVP17_003627 [Porospora cf. gigantea B]
MRRFSSCVSEHASWWVPVMCHTKQTAARRCRRTEKIELLKVQASVETGGEEDARTHAENVVQKRDQAHALERLASRLESSACRLDAAYRSQQMTSEISSAVPKLAKALRVIDAGRVTDSFEAFSGLFEDLDLNANYVNSALDHTTSNLQVEQVEQVISEVVQEVGAAIDRAAVPKDSKLECQEVLR